jgi:putative ABC transport system permease protein
MVLADWRAMRGTAWVAVLLIALAVAIGVAVGAQERGLRRASARAADDFPLLIGAAGSQTSLVLTAVYLQLDALPLIDGGLLNTLAADRRVAGAAPLAFGDLVNGYPVIGTTANFVTRWGRLAPAEGRVFANADEAVLGIDVRLSLGDGITPTHGLEEAEGGHKHEGVVYRVVGRLPRTGSPWDRAILIPVESVWETHGLGNGHAADPAPAGFPFDAAPVPGVPAIVVKPKGVADAYTLRQQYRKDGTMALFPAEVLVPLYRGMGDVRSVLVVASALNDGLLFLAVVLLVVVLVGLRRRRYAVLRALGAPASYVMLVVWLGTTGLIAAGCALGLCLGAAASAAFGWWLAARTGLAEAALPGEEEALMVLALMLAGGVVALAPAWLAIRGRVSESLRD